MTWNEMYDKENKPDFKAVADYVACKYWDELCDFVERTYSIAPIMDYSKCSAAPGWNVKYRKSSKSLCTLYPNKDYFTCLISIGRKEAPETEFILNACTSYVQELYKKSDMLNGARWLMIDVTTGEILKDVLELLCIRIHPPKKQK